MFFDPMYFIIVGPAILLSMYAQYKVKSTYKNFSKVAALSGMTGSEVARELLDSNGLSGIGVEQVKGELTDHYDPKSKVLRLSQGIYNGSSLSALGIAAHEAGHALQDHAGYVPMKIRAGLVPSASLGTKLGPILIIIGFIFMSGSTLGNGVIQLGIVFFAAAVLFQIVTLPVEFDASKRAITLLSDGGYIKNNEYSATKKVLNAAALTYLAAALAAITQLLYFILLSQRRR